MINIKTDTYELFLFKLSYNNKNEYFSQVKLPLKRTLLHSLFIIYNFLVKSTNFIISYKL